MRGTAIGNARWIAASRLASIGFQLLSLFWLARLLVPADYGLVAMAFVVTNLAALVQDLGFSMALIQRETLSSETIGTAFWVTFGIGLLLAVLVAASAPLAAHAYGEPRVQGLLFLLALLFPIGGFATVHKAMLERESRFRTLARIEITSASLSLTVALTAAYLGAGPYSLVLMSLTGMLAATSQLRVAYRLKSFEWRRAEFDALRRFGTYITGANILTYFANNADGMLIGRILGAASLGIYSLAVRIIHFPVDNLTGTASRAIYPLLSRNQADSTAMTGLYLRAAGLVAFISAPLAAGVWVMREPLVDVMLGDRWQDVAGVLIWLAPIGFSKAINATTGVLMAAKHRPEQLFRLGMIYTASRIAGLVIGLNWGLLGAAAGYCIASVANMIPAFLVMHRLLAGGAFGLLKAVGLPLAMALAMVLIVSLFMSVLPAGGYPALLRLLLFSSIGAVVYAALSGIFARQSLIDLATFLGWRCMPTQ